MLLKLLLLFVVLPLVELAILLKLSEWMGWKTTLAVVVVTGLVGTALARHQGVGTYRRIQAEMSRGRLPTDSLFDGFLIFVAGALLVTPGILTDLFGMSLLVPACRKFYRAQVVKWFKSRFRVETFRTGSDRRPSSDSPTVIDSYVVDDDRPTDDDRRADDDRQRGGEGERHP